MTSPFSWIKPDETATEALVRILTDRPFVVLPPPLHRLPFRVGNVVEIVGPSPSAKTLILIQAAVNCILPKEWKGVQYGGLDRAVIFVDLECRFDVLSLSRVLKQRINDLSNQEKLVYTEGPGSSHYYVFDEIYAEGIIVFSSDVKGGRISMKWSEDEYDIELFTLCMKRFLYFRCYNSLEFLATLKTMHCQLQKGKETQDTGIYMLMIDSIGAFYWIERALQSSSSASNNRKSHTFQSITETIVQEIQRLLLVHPMLVLASKAALFVDKQSTTEVIRNSGKRLHENTFELQGHSNPTHREYMPSVWQSFVTHRILLRASDGNGKHKMHPTFSTHWLLPPLKLSDTFIVNDVWMVA